MIDEFKYNDGGRKAAGYAGSAGDCVVRSIAIVTGYPYQRIYDEVSQGCRAQRVTKHGNRKASARDGVNTSRKWFKDYMIGLGFEWVPTMAIGSGCKVHLAADELPQGRIIVRVSRHYTAMIDGVIHDTHDPRRDIHHFEPDRGQPLKSGQWRNPNGICSVQRRCVYGYWRFRV